MEAGSAWSWRNQFLLNEFSRWESYGSNRTRFRSEGTRARRRRPPEGHHAIRRTANGSAFRPAPADRRIDFWITTGRTATGALRAADKGWTDRRGHLETITSPAVAAARAHSSAYSSRRPAIPTTAREITTAPATTPPEPGALDFGCLESAGSHSSFSVQATVGKRLNRPGAAHGAGNPIKHVTAVHHVVSWIDTRLSAPDSRTGSASAKECQSRSTAICETRCVIVLFKRLVRLPDPRGKPARSIPYIVRVKRRDAGELGIAITGAEP